MKITFLNERKNKGSDDAKSVGSNSSRRLPNVKLKNLFRKNNQFDLIQINKLTNLKIVEEEKEGERAEIKLVSTVALLIAKLPLPMRRPSPIPALTIIR